MSAKETDLYPLCTLQDLTKESVQRRSTTFHGFPVAAVNYSSIGQTLTAFDIFSNHSLSTSNLFSPVKCLERCRVFGGLFLDVDL